jgi:hypothetical protein
MPTQTQASLSYSSKFSLLIASTWLTWISHDSFPALAPAYESFFAPSIENNIHSDPFAAYGFLGNGARVAWHEQSDERRTKFLRNCCPNRI